ncbi:hypothetical protein TorRG33x02_011380 [Trema orientale]|uniref:Cupredoxin n=1 Tax=Trema orientale TaxID=63057 RepID=A0A2P5FZ80_TREOI|nr:hypothetical protein TorRG33x02_011380 [Trema orientale]
MRINVIGCSIQVRSPPTNGPLPHSVYLLPDLILSFIKCDLSRAEKAAETTQGDGQGFEFPLKSWKPYDFACGESNGIHCDLGLMKFFVLPMLRGWNK